MKRKIIALITAVVMVLAMMPAMAFADDGSAQQTAQISFNELSVIGHNTDREADIYYYGSDQVPAELEFVDLEDLMEYGMISSFGNYYEEESNKVALGDGYKLTYEQLIDSKYVKGYLTEPLAKSCDYYGFWITDDDGDEYILIVRGESYEEKTYDFTASSEGTVLTNIETKEKAYSYTNWNNEKSVADLYVITVPRGTAKVDFEIDNPVLAYNYKKISSTDDDYLAGYYEGALMYNGVLKFSVNTDCNNDEEFDFIQVQTPYDTYWNTTLICAITFRYSDEDTAAIAEEKIGPLLADGDKASVAKALEIYEGLTDAQKALLSKNILKAMEIAEDAVAAEKMSVIDAKNAAAQALRELSAISTSKYTKSSVAIFDDAKKALKTLIKSDTATAMDLKMGILDLNNAYLDLQEKAANTLTVKAKKVTVSKKQLKKKKVTVKAAKALTVTKAVGNVTYSKAGGSAKIAVSKNGKLTVKKKTKKGTYSVKVKVIAAGNDNVLAGAKTVTVKVKVK